jgi:rhodanese-related sulfurtransferase
MKWDGQLLPNMTPQEVVMKKLLRLTLISAYLAVTFGILCLTASAQEIDRIKPEELKKLIDSKADIVVVDNQPKAAYDIEHIPGAINFPWATQIKGPVNLPRDKTLILYCACDHEEDSTHVAKQLVNHFGYRNIKLLDGGWLRWIGLGYPAERRSPK